MTLLLLDKPEILSLKIVSREKFSSRIREKESLLKG